MRLELVLKGSEYIKVGDRILLEGLEYVVITSRGEQFPPHPYTKYHLEIGWPEDCEQIDNETVRLNVDGNARVMSWKTSEISERDKAIRDAMSVRQRIGTPPPLRELARINIRNENTIECDECGGLGYSKVALALHRHISSLMWDRAVDYDLDYRTVTSFLAGPSRRRNGPYGHDEIDAHEAVRNLGVMAGLPKGFDICARCEGRGKVS